MITETVKTIVEQIKILDPLLFLSSTKIVIDDKTLRLVFRNNRANYKADIQYSRGNDLYDIVIYRVSNFNLDVVKVKEAKDIFFEQITQVIREVIK